MSCGALPRLLQSVYFYIIQETGLCFFLTTRHRHPWTSASQNWKSAKCSVLKRGDNLAIDPVFTDLGQFKSLCVRVRERDKRTERVTNLKCVCIDDLTKVADIRFLVVGHWAQEKKVVTIRNPTSTDFQVLVVHKAPEIHTLHFASWAYHERISNLQIMNIIIFIQDSPLYRWREHAQSSGIQWNDSAHRIQTLPKPWKWIRVTHPPNRVSVNANCKKSLITRHNFKDLT